MLIQQPEAPSADFLVAVSPPIISKKMRLKNATTDQLIAFGEQCGMSPRSIRRIQTLIIKKRQSALPPVLEHVSKVRWTDFIGRTEVPHLQVVDKVVSTYDSFAKYAFRGEDQGVFEAVRIPLLHRPGNEKYIVCVSTQVGCGVGCAFCATGRLGFRRNLEPWEIVDQVLKIQDDSEHAVRGVVFMGMGEPFLNYKNVMSAADILSDPSGGAIDGKSITISTAGIVPMIRRFATDGRSFRLITSLHAATNELRDELVPLNRNYPLEEIFAALREYETASRRRVIIAWTMIAGVNMSREQARALAELSKGMRLLVDLIPVNDVTGRFTAPTLDETRTFISYIQEEVRCPVNVRYSGGKDVHGACGMLAGEHFGGPLL